MTIAEELKKRIWITTWHKLSEIALDQAKSAHDDLEEWRAWSQIATIGMMRIVDLLAELDEEKGSE